MKYFLSVFIVLFFTIIGCSNDDDGTMSNPDIDSSGLMGAWNMDNVSGGFLGLDHNFESGAIVWNFDDTNKTVQIVNNNPDDTIEDMLPSGTYDYSIIEVNGNLEFIVNDINRGNFELTNNQFSISEQFRDGIVFKFSR